MDESVIELLEKHCTLEVPTMLPYQLVRMEALPKDYEIEPVAKDFSIAGKDTDLHLYNVARKVARLSLGFRRHVISLDDEHGAYHNQ